jgi:hypothetical protein
MEILKLNKCKKAQAQFVFIILAVLLSVLLIGSLFIVFNEIKTSNEEIKTLNNLELFGEKIASSITETIILGKNIEYSGSQKALINKTLRISDNYLEYIVSSSENLIVITHKEKTKEIKIHNLNISIEGSIRGRNTINIVYYRNETSDWIELK